MSIPRIIIALVATSLIFTGGLLITGSPTTNPPRDLVHRIELIQPSATETATPADPAPAPEVPVVVASPVPVAAPPMPPVPSPVQAAPLATATPGPWDPPLASVEAAAPVIINGQVAPGGYVCWSDRGYPIPQAQNICPAGWGGRPPEHPLPIG